MTVTYYKRRLESRSQCYVAIVPSELLIRKAIAGAHNAELAAVLGILQKVGFK